jgi:TolB-like protein
MLALLALSLASLTAPGPVAVAPWRNLSSAEDLRFLEQGAAETMTADLRRAGVAVVERLQLQQALATLPPGVTGDVERAVAAGRVVGAKSVVVGSFQRQGGQLRLVARVVVVETGEVGEAGSATGAVDDVFALQDKVVAGILGRAPPPRAKAPRVASYRRFGAALSSSPSSPSSSLSSPAAMAAPLEAIVVDDPDFSYAGEALMGLEQRLAAQGPGVAIALDERTRALLAVVEDAAADVARRQQAAVVLLDTLQGARRLHALIAAADRIIAARLPVDVIVDVAERAAAARVVALLQLVRIDAGLQAAERYLKEHPAGGSRAAVEAALRDSVERRRSEARRRAEFAAELQELAADVASATAVDDDRRRSFRFKPCIAAKWSTLPSEMVARCRAYLQQHGADVDDDGRDHARSARAYVAWGHALRGDFAAARDAAAVLERDDPGALDDTGLRGVMTTWSTD